MAKLSSFNLRALSRVLLAALVFGVVCGSDSEFNDQLDHFRTKHPTYEEFDRMFLDEDHVYLLVVHASPCELTCQKNAQLLIENFSGLSANRSDLVLSLFDISKIEELKQELQLYRSHRVLILDAGEITEIENSPQDGKTVLEYVKEYLNDSKLFVLTSAEQLDALVQNHRSFYAYFGNLDSNSYRIFVANSRNSDATFAAFDDEAIAVKLGIHEDGVYLVDGSERPLKQTITDMQTFIHAAAWEFPVSDFDRALNILNKRVPILLAPEQHLEALAGLSDQIRQSMALVAIDRGTLKSEQVIQGFLDKCTFGLDPATKFCIYHMVTDKKIFRYRYTHDMDPALLKAYFEDFQQGKAAIYRKTELIDQPATNKVLNLNADSFEALVRKYSGKIKTALLIFYYPSDCKICDEFQQVFESIADDFDSEDVQFARINFNENELDQFKDLIYPTIQLTVGFDPNRTFPYGRGLNEKNLRAFIKQYRYQVRKPEFAPEDAAEAGESPSEEEKEEVVEPLRNLELTDVEL